MAVVTERRPTVDDAYEALEALGQATRKELAEHLGCAKWLAGELVDEMVADGVARRCRFERTGKAGRPAPIFALVKSRAVAMELRSGAMLHEVAAPVKPLKDLRDRPVRSCTLAEIAPTKKATTPKPKKRPRVNGKIKKRRKGKHGADAVLRRAAELGYTVSETKKGHHRFDKPGQPPLFGVGLNPSDHRSTKNTIAMLERGYG